MDQLWLWVGFNLFVLAMLAVDLFVFHREAHEVRTAEAAGWSVLWVALALAFGAGVYAFMGRDAGLEYFAGLSAVLVFVGAKMLLSDIYKIPVGISLGVVAFVLAASVAASLLWPRPAAKGQERS